MKTALARFSANGYQGEAADGTLRGRGDQIGEGSPWISFLRIYQFYREEQGCRQLGRGKCERLVLVMNGWDKGDTIMFILYTAVVQ